MPQRPHAPSSRTVFVPLAAGLLTLTALATPVSAASSHHPAVPLFSGPTGASLLPAEATTGNLLSTVALSSKDVWTFGYSEQEGGNPALAQHYDGHTWTTVDIPSPGGAVAVYPYAATALASDDVWVVGHSEDADGIWSTVTEHWDGTSWTIVPSPDQDGAADSYLYAVSGSSPDDVWAVGTGLTASGNNTTFAIHWDGSSWSVADVPAPSATFSELNGVAAIAPDDVWAAGAYQSDTGLPSLLEHWDGTEWTVVDSPNEEGALLTQFGPLVAFGAKNIWSIGYEADSTGTLLPLAAHYNGKHWRIKLMENPAGSLGSLLVAGSGSGPKNVWAAGIYLDSTGVGQPLIEHYTGKRWKVTAAEAPGGATNSQLTGISSPTRKQGWAVGLTQVGGADQTLLEHWHHKHWSVK
jgi:hypothetical protein